MPITTKPPVAGFTLYYSLVGNNNTPGSADYRSNNPWQAAKKFCAGLASSHSSSVTNVASLDDSVFQVTLAASVNASAVANTILNDLAKAIAPAAAGDKLVAVVPNGSLLEEIVHHTP